jgi:diol dehydratase reactivase alpha subunit
MAILVGIDVGNSTTEVTIATVFQGCISFLSDDIVPTTGMKGTIQNKEGIKKALLNALKKAGHGLEDVETIYMNDATPVVGDIAMDTIAETIITDSAMIGHNPSTPGGKGIGTGKTVLIESIKNCVAAEKAIVIVNEQYSFKNAADLINKGLESNIDIQGVIVQKNDGVLIANRLKCVIPIVDEVSEIGKIPLNMHAVVEVAELGRTISQLCNPYSLAALFGLDASETKNIAPVAVSLTGNRSAVVIKTPKGTIKEHHIPVGKLIFKTSMYSREVDIACGADKIMSVLNTVGDIDDVEGEYGTAIGGMVSGIKETLSEISKQPSIAIKVQDIFAVDSIVPQRIKGGLAGEVCLSKAVGIAAMVWTDSLLIEKLVCSLKEDLDIETKIGGIEVHMAVLGTLTTPGVEKPAVILDLGAGSIDAGYINREGIVLSAHLAGAGELVTRLIDAELGLNNRDLAEEIKRHPAAKVESLFHIVLEDGSVKFFEQPLDLSLFGRVVLLKENGEIIPIHKNISLTKLVATRREAKRKVMVNNAVRALKKILPDHDLRMTDNLILIGGCALDFEIPGLMAEFFLNNYGIVTGTGNIKGSAGPRGAVATGLILANAI